MCVLSCRTDTVSLATVQQLFGLFARRSVGHTALDMLPFFSSCTTCRFPIAIKLKQRAPSPSEGTVAYGRVHQICRRVHAHMQQRTRVNSLEHHVSPN